MIGSLLHNRSGGWIIAAAVFILDLLTPFGYALPMLYVLPILLTWLVAGWQNTVLVASCGLMLTWVETLYSPGEFTSQARSAFHARTH